MDHIISWSGNEQSTNKRNVNLITNLRESNKEFETGLEHTRQEHDKYMNELLQNINKGVTQTKNENKNARKSFLDTMRTNEQKLQKMKDKYIEHIDLKKKGKLKKNIVSNPAMIMDEIEISEPPGDKHQDN